jgi:hypothetical protein
MPRKYVEGEPKKGATVRERVSAYRRRMRAMGYRPLEVWVPDTRDPRFRASFRKQCRAVAAAERNDAAMEAWLDANAADLLDGIDRTEQAAGAAASSWGPESPL